MSESNKLLSEYFFAAICLTAIVVFNDNRSDGKIVAAVKSLELEVRSLDEDLCETINQMHQLRGFKVPDCKNKRVLLVPVDEEP